MTSNTRILVTGTILTLALAGCGTSQNDATNTSPANTTNSANAGNTMNMGNMTMGNMTMDNQTSGTSHETSGLAQAFQDELNGFSTIQNDVNKGDYTSATSLANNLHDEFHAAILPPLKAKKGNTYAEDIHSKYDALQDAIKDKNTTQISQLIQVNRTNLYTVAQILGVTLQE